MATIASLNINLGLNSAGFDKGARSAVDSLKSIEKSSFATAAATGAMAVGQAFSFVADRAMDAARAVKQMVTESLNGIDALKDTAQTAGVTTDALSALQYAATLNGSSADAVSLSLSVLNAKLGKAAREGGPVAEALAEIGLSARDLVAMSPDQALAEIAGGFDGVMSASQRAHIAQQIFGKSSRDLLNLLDLGKDGLAAATAEAERFGLTISQVDANQVGAAKDALDQAQAVLGAVKNRLAVELAPFIEVAAKKFVELATSGEGFGAKVTTAVEMVATGVAHLADFVDLLKVGWLSVKVTVLGVTAGILHGVDQMGAAIMGFLDALPQVEATWTDMVGNMARSLEEQMGESIAEMDRLMSRDRSADVAAAFAGMREQAEAAAEAQAEAAAKAAADGRAKEAFAAAVTDGIAAGIEGAKGLWGRLKESAAPFTDQLKGMFSGGGGSNGFLKGLESAAKSLFDATRTPAEQFEATLTEMQDMLSRGLIDEDTFARGVEKAKGSLADSIASDIESALGADPGEFRQISARTDVRGLGSMGRGNPQVEAQKEANRLLAEANATLDRIAEGSGGVA